MVIDLLWWLLIISAAGYLLVMLTITIGWFRIRRFEGQPQLPLINVSVVVAVRNEEKNIRRLLDSLHKLDYPREALEIILVDDHSEDLTRKIIGAFRKENRIDHIILGKPEKYGKKAAIAHGF